MSADETLEWMRSRGQRWTAEIGEEHARGLMDALLREQQLPRQERGEWLAYLFDNAPSHPAPFALTGEDSTGPTWTDHRLVELVAQRNWAEVEHHLLSQGWPAEAVSETIRLLIEAPPPAGDDEAQ